jgi:hypothetical protein
MQQLSITQIGEQETIRPEDGDLNQSPSVTPLVQLLLDGHIERVAHLL